MTPRPTSPERLYPGWISLTACVRATVWSWRIESVDRIIRLRGRGGTCDVQFRLGSVYAKGDCLVKVCLVLRQVKLGVGGLSHQVCFSVSGVNLNHAVYVFVSRSVLTRFGVNQGPVDQDVNVIRLQDYGLTVVSNGFPKVSKVVVDHS